MKRFALGTAIISTVALAAGVSSLAQAPPTISVVRDPGCGCCLKWVSHLEQAGFKATVTESTDMDSVKKKHGVPNAAASCHTAVVDGFVVEGHVPAADIKRLLKERPKVAGLAVPAMPLGSPGMEVPSGQVQPYDVVAFDKSGATSVFASHR
jgi:hypothetical protein